MIVAARGEQVAVRTDGDGAAPAAMGVENTFGLWRFGIAGPDQELAGVVGAEELILPRQKRQAAHPAAVADERRLAPTRDLPALDGVVLRRGEHEATGRIEPAADQRAVVPQFEGHPGAGGIDRKSHVVSRNCRRYRLRLSVTRRLDGNGRPHALLHYARTSLIASACGSAMGIGRPSW